MFGSTELIIIVLIVFVLFGASAIPKFARSIGQARKEFDNGMKEAESVSKTIETETSTSATSSAS